MTNLEKLRNDLRVTIADEFERRKFARFQYEGEKDKASVEITADRIKVILGEGDTNETTHEVLFTSTDVVTLLDLIKHYTAIPGMKVDLDPNIVISYNITGLFYQPKTSIIFNDDNPETRTPGVDLYVSSFYPNYVYDTAIEDAVSLVKEGYDVEDLDPSELVYVKWLAAMGLCNKRGAALLESVSKLTVIEKETVNLGKISITSDTSLSQDVQSIAKHWHDMAKQYQDLAKKFIDDGTGSMPEVVIGHKTVVDSITGNEIPLRNIEASQRIEIKFTKLRNDLILNWTQLRGADFKEYRVYSHTESFHVPMKIADMPESVTLETTITDSQYPEYVMADFYAGLSEGQSKYFKIVALNMQNTVIKSKELVITK